MPKGRLILTDEAWQAIAAILAKSKPKAGSPPRQSERLLIEAVLYGARPGSPWRELPEEFGQWDAVYNRLRRGAKRQVWQRFWHALQAEQLTVATPLFIDSTIVRAHQQAAGALKKTADKRHRLWDVLGGAFPPNSTPDVSRRRPA